VETQNSQEKLDALLRQANVLRMRGQTAEAEERCRAVLELAAEEPTALEMVGDLLRGRGQLDAAADHYRRAAAAAPDRPSPEKKVAEVALEIAERQRQRDEATLLLTTPAAPSQPRRNVMFAFLLSGVFPGLGQFYNHEPVKGGLLVLGNLICLGVGGEALFRLMITVATAHASGTVDQFGAWAGFLGLVLWLYAVIDAVVTAQKLGAGRAE
jgi:tetratricopeptide (TPR) repeat protein